MSYTKISKLVRDLDDEDLYKYRHRGVPVWEVIKRKVIVENFENSLGAGRLNHAEFSVKRLFNMGYFFVVSALQFCVVRKQKKYIFLGFSRRFKTSDGYVDHYHDHLIQELGADECLMLERPVKGTHLKPRKYSYTVAYLDFMCYISELFSRAGRMNISSSDFNELAAELTARGLKAPSLRGVNREINKYKIERFFVKMILPKENPKCITVTSKWLHLPFIAVANERGIPVYEVQHGARFYYNLAYQGFGDFNHHRVDAVLTTGEQWNSLPWESANIVTIGNPHLSVRGKKNKANKKDRNTVLFISQPEMWEAIKCDLGKLADKNPEFHITLRLHPQDVGYVRSRYEQLLKYVNISFEFPEYDVVESIERHSMVVGYTSTVIFQAVDKGANVALIVGEGVSEYEYKEIFGSVIESFHLVKDYNLAHIPENPKVCKGKFFSPFRPEIWRMLARGELIGY